VKIAFVGAGSYVFGPSILSQIYLEQKLQDVDLALIDPDLQTIDLLANVGRRMARENGLKTTITSHAERQAGLSGADFVICSASPQMKKRTAIDWEIIDKYIPGHQKSEFGGIAGLSYSLRQIALIESISDDMRQLCPHAWLLDAANPLPRVTQAAQENGIKTAGFCVAAISVYAMLWNIFFGEWLDFPFVAGRKKWELYTAGLNHFSWLLEFRDRASGIDLMPLLREQSLRNDAPKMNPVALQFLHDLGFLLVPGDEHTKDFLKPLKSAVKESVEPWHGNPNQRKERLELLKSVGDGQASWDGILKGEAWEKPIRFVDAMSGGPAADFHSMNLINDLNQVSNLPTYVFVETPCHVSGGKIVPKQVTLPEPVVNISRQTAAVTNAIVRAAREKRRSLVHEAVQMDPTVLDKRAGIEAIDICLLAHSDLLPVYS
jgi:alpha-galactosidase